MALKNLTVQQKAILRSRARAGDVQAREAINSIDNEVSVNGTTAPLTLYVSTTGDDRNSGTLLFPFRQPQAALDSLPKNLRHLVKLSIGAGNFDGFKIQGFTVNAENDSNTCGIHVIGTLNTPALTGGTASGSFTAVTAGTSNPAVHAVVTDSAQSWVVNELKGKLLEFVTGTSALTLVPIISNTATTMTLAATIAQGSVSGTYAIRGWGSVITRSVPAGSAIAAANATSQPNPLSNGISVQDNNCLSSQIRLEYLDVSPTSAAAGVHVRGIYFNGSPGNIARCNVGGTQSLGVQTAGFITVSLAQSVITTTSSGSALFCGSHAQNITITGCLVKGGGGTSIALNLSSHGGNIILNSSKLEGCGFGIDITAPAHLNLSGTRITTSGSQAIRCRGGAASATAGVWIEATGLDCSDAGTGIEMLATGAIQITNLTGSGLTNGIILGGGARMKLGPTSTITGTTECTLDGVSVLIANMRAANPKLLTNTYGTILYE